MVGYFGQTYFGGSPHVVAVSTPPSAATVGTIREISVTGTTIREVAVTTATASIREVPVAAATIREVSV